MLRHYFAPKYRYTAFGLNLASATPIPGLDLLPATNAADLAIFLGAASTTYPSLDPSSWRSFYVSPYMGEFGIPILEVWRHISTGEFRWRYDDGTEFFIDSDATTVLSRWPEDLSLADSAAYLLGPVMGFLLHRRGRLCLHASAVAIKDVAIGILGPAGAGKSTTAAGFARMGYPVISDDIAVIEPAVAAFMVQPGYPRLCLCPDAVDTLYGTLDALPLISPNWDKRYLDLAGPEHIFQTSALPLAAVYRLDDRSAAGFHPKFRDCTPRESLLDLLGNTYVNYLLEPGQRASEFALLGRLVAQVPLRRVTPPEDHSRLSAFCQAVAEDFLALARKSEVRTG
jgi:hypothetical protein